MYLAKLQGVAIQVTMANFRKKFQNVDCFPLIHM